MLFIRWLRTLDELLYELLSWLVFFPATLWRTIRHPLSTMAYAEDQLKLEPELQYRAIVSPPVMLVLSLMLCQAIELTLEGTNPVVESHRGLGALVNDNTSLLLLRLFLFGIFPLVLATRKVQLSSENLDRDTLKPPFYAQCLIVAPFALMLSVGATVVLHQHHPVTIAIGVGILVAAFLFYGIVETHWFRLHLQLSTLRAFANASLGLISSIVIALAGAYLFLR